MTPRPTRTVCRLGAVLCLTILSLSFAVGCAERATRERPPVLLVGLDGFEWSVVLPLLADGRMPHLSALMQRGTYGELRSMVPTSSPIIWTSIATGQGRERHGITGFRKNGRLIDSNQREVKAFWNVLGDYDRRVAVIGWWATWPVEAVNGVMVAQMNVRGPKAGVAKGSVIDGVEGQVHPPALEPSVFAAAHALDRDLEAITTGIFGQRWDASAGRFENRLWNDSLWSIRADILYQRIALDLLAEEAGFDVLAVYFGGPDVLGHRFWRYMEPERYAEPPTAEATRELGHLIADYYAHVDRMLGELVAAADEDAVVVVVSDHGMHAIATDQVDFEQQPRKRSNSGGHRDAPAAFFTAAGPGIRASGALPRTRAEITELGSVLDVFPTLCVILGLPLAEDFEGQVLAQTLEPSLLSAGSGSTVASFTPDGWHEHREKGAFDRTTINERLEQLRGLGYIE